MGKSLLKKVGPYVLAGGSLLVGACATNKHVPAPVKDNKPLELNYTGRSSDEIYADSMKTLNLSKEDLERIHPELKGVNLGNKYTYLYIKSKEKSEPKESPIEKKVEHFQKQEMQKETDKEKSQWYVIKSAKDTFYSLSKRFYGTGNDVQKIIDANPGVDYTRLKIGDKILIPKE